MAFIFFFVGRYSAKKENVKLREEIKSLESMIHEIQIVQPSGKEIRKYYYFNTPGSNKTEQLQQKEISKSNLLFSLTPNTPTVFDKIHERLKNIGSYYGKPSHGIFSIYCPQINQSIKQDTQVDILVEAVDDDMAKDMACLVVWILIKNDSNSQTQLKQYVFKTQGIFNRLNFPIDLGAGTYEMEIGTFLYSELERTQDFLTCYMWSNKLLIQ